MRVTREMTIEEVLAMDEEKVLSTQGYARAVLRAGRKKEKRASGSFIFIARPLRSQPLPPPIIGRLKIAFL